MSENQHEQLMAEYHRVIAQRNSARRLLMGFCILTIMIFGMFTWRAGEGFAHQGLQVVGDQVGQHLQANSQEYTLMLSKTATQILSAYRLAISRQIEKDLPKLEVVTHEELTKLNQYTQARWKDFEYELKNMSADHEKIMKEELAKILTEEQANELFLAYGLEVEGRMQTFLKSAFGEHLRVGEQIASNIHRITELEPELSHPVDVHHAIGLILELAGLEFQNMQF